MRFGLVIALTGYFFIESGGNPNLHGDISEVNITDRKGGGRGASAGGNSGSYGVNDCSGGGVRGWEDPFNGHHEEKGDECISVKVTKVRDSDIEMMAFASGRYFTFSEEEMNHMLGTRDWDQKVIKVVQKGSRSWVGEVKIYNDNKYMFSDWLTGEWRIYGERATGGADWQWKAGDSIHLSSCVPTDCFVKKEWIVSIQKWYGVSGPYVRDGCNLKELKKCIPCQKRGWDYWFEPQASTDWGKWGPVKLCPSNGFAIGFDLKVQNNGGSYCDDTALNAIRLICKDSRGKESYLDSGENVGLALGFFWHVNELRCSGGRKLTGANLKTEGKQLAGDDTAANNLAMMCGKHEKLYRSGDRWGNWGSWSKSGYKYCPNGMAICGLQTKVEEWDDGRKDNTALNRVAFYCCYPPNDRMDVCAVLKVDHINHWRDGQSGMYFYFSESDLNKKIGSGWEHGTKFEVIQEGSNSWTGEVMVFKHSTGAHGRRVKGAREGQWKKGDTIKFKNC